MRTISPDQTHPHEVGQPGGRYVMTDYLGSYSARQDGPQAYLVRQGAAELRAHFHEVDQFQVVVDGVGTLGRDDVHRGSLHYADAFTTYGPIRTDPDAGLAYFTLRSTPTTGLNYMPEEREKRARTRGLGEHFTCQVPNDLGREPVELGRTRRGAVAWGCRLRVDDLLSVRGLSSQEGYLVVLHGEVRAGGSELPAEGLIHFSDPAELAGVQAVRDTTVALLVFAPDEPGSGKDSGGAVAGRSVDGPF